MTKSSVATETRRQEERNTAQRAEFAAKCRAVADAMARAGTRLRIALTEDGGAEPFLIHARYEIRSRMHVDPPRETETAIDDALTSTGSDCRAFLTEAAETGRRLRRADTPIPVATDSGTATGENTPRPAVRQTPAENHRDDPDHREPVPGQLF